MREERLISDRAARELLELSASDALRRDLEIVRSQRHHPFLKNGTADVEVFIEFVIQYNDFINHEPKPFKPMTDRVARL